MLDTIPLFSLLTPKTSFLKLQSAFLPIMEFL